MRDMHDAAGNPLLVNNLIGDERHAAVERELKAALQTAVTLQKELATAKEHAHKEEMRAIKAAAALFVLDKKTISVQRTRAAEIAKAVTLGDQLAAWGQATEQSIDVPRLATKLAEIEA